MKLNVLDSYDTMDGDFITFSKKDNNIQDPLDLVGSQVSIGSKIAIVKKVERKAQDEISAKVEYLKGNK